MKLLSVFALLSSAAAMELTPETFDEAVDGKTVFIKFLAPWCGHCKKMKPAWDSLMADYKDHPTKLVADVDCTAAGKPLCDSNGVKGFPTILYGDPADLQKYEGGRDEKALKKFAEEKLNPMCSPKNIDLCDDDKKAQIEKFQGMSVDELKKLIDEAEAEMKEVEATFKKNVEGLQKQYEGFMKEKEEKTQAVKDAGLGIMKSVAAASKKTKDEL